MSARPYRHLCPEADSRDAMTDEEFWAHVAEHILGPQWGIDDEGPTISSIDASPCGECGEIGACAYDSEGRALIHASDDADES